MYRFVNRLSIICDIKNHLTFNVCDLHNVKTARILIHAMLKV